MLIILQLLTKVNMVSNYLNQNLSPFLASHFNLWKEKNSISSLKKNLTDT